MNFSIQKEFLKEHSEYLGRRNYYSIDENGKIIKKDINFALILSAYSDNWEDTKEKINRDFIWKDEKKKIRMPERMTEISVEQLKKKFIKTVLNGDEVFSLKYGYELFLRDFTEFKRVTLFFSLINQKCLFMPLYAASFFKMVKNGEKDDFKILFLFIDLLTLFPKDFSGYEESLSSNEYIEFKNCEGIKKNGALIALDMLKEIGHPLLSEIENSLSKRKWKECENKKELSGIKLI